ncbi:MAG: diheme cytochrome c [Mariprofundus sp.]|nr:diheme cytochrome c [Mariprofundus sp.]
MKHKRIWGILLFTGCLGLSMASLAWTNEDGEHEDREEGGRFMHATANVPIVANKAYQTECSACHFAYQPGFLPERSWLEIMTTLDDHFGENAELDAATQESITRYLQLNAADQSPNRFSRSVLRSIQHVDTPLRITKTPFFEHKHREIPVRMVANNTKVRSFSNCLACHSMAGKGVFDEDSVRIPGFGRWED